MSVIELIPLDKGNRLILDDTTVTNIGRTPNIGCMDKKISRNHAELYVKSDGTLWIKSIHNNPTFYKTKTNQLITLTKDQEHQLYDNDQIGLLPNEYFYRISIKSKNKENENEETIQPSTVSKSPIQEEEESSPIKEKEPSVIPKSPIQQRETSPSKDPTLEPEGGVILHTSRALPTWMSKQASQEVKSTKGRGKGKTPTTTPTKVTPSPSKYRTYIGRKKAEGVVYEDDDDEDEVPASASAPISTDKKDQNSLKVTPSTKRERCPYGKFCYRKNPIHRQEAIHPGDPDWDDKENDTNTKKPECPYGTDCYRKNPDHINEYSHTKKPSKRKAKSDDEDEDDDGLPNEYDYNDSFINDEDLEDSARIDRAASFQSDPDRDWKPHKKVRLSKRADDDDETSTDESELSLLNEEAEEFIDGSSVNHDRSAKKKACGHLVDDED